MDECNLNTRLDLLDALQHLLKQSSSLVKVFVSSQDNQDIMLKLSSYLNLAINSRRNSNNITQFVNAEVEHLTKARKLLPHSPA
jgi:hypothetical protein